MTAFLVSCRRSPLRWTLAVLIGGCGPVGPVPQPEPESSETAQARWLRADLEGCRDGDAQACEHVADRYVDLETGRQDGPRAAEFFQKACDLRLQSACVKLGRLLVERELVAPDAARARPLFAQACEDGDAGSCYELAVLHANGDGGPRDYGAAAPLLRKACAKDFSRACEMLDALERDRLVRPDVGRFGGGGPPAEVTLAHSSAPYAASLRRHFAERILTPFPYPIDELPVAPANLCQFVAVRAGRDGPRYSVSGRLTVAPLPPGLQVGRRSARPGGYRRWVMGFVVARDGRLAWSGEGSLEGKEFSEASGARNSVFTIAGEAPSESLAGATLVLLVSGDPISVSAADRGGVVVLGSFFQRL